MVDIKSYMFNHYGNMYDHLEIFFCVYAYVKSFFQYFLLANKKSYFMAIVVQFGVLALTNTVYILGCVVILPMIVYCKFIDTLLQYKLKNLYGGLLGNGAFLTHTKCPCFATVLLMFHYYGEEEDFYSFMKHTLLRFYNSDFKFASTINNFLGYSYYLKDQIKFEDVLEGIDYVDDQLAVDNLLLGLIKNINETPVIKDNALWEAKICKRGLLVANNSQINMKLYPVVIRYHHSIADLVSFLSLWKMLFNDEKFSETKDVKARKRPCFNLKEISNITYDVLNLERMHVKTNLFGSSNRRSIPKFTTSGSEKLAIFFEKTRKYFPIVKQIQKKFKGIKFTEIIFAALSASLHNYYTQIGKCPDKININVIARPRSEDTDNISKGIYKFDELSNNFTFTYLTLLPFGGNHMTVSERLSAIHDKWTSKNSLDEQVIYWLKDVMSYFPDIVYRFTFILNLPDVIVSNLPGIILNHGNGLKLRDFFFYAPMGLTESFRMFINTQDERFHVMLGSTEDGIENTEDLQIILNNMFVEIDKLHGELGTI